MPGVDLDIEAKRLLREVFPPMPPIPVTGGFVDPQPNRDTRNSRSRCRGLFACCGIAARPRDEGGSWLSTC